MAVVFTDTFDGYANGTPADESKYDVLTYGYVAAVGPQLTYQAGALQLDNGSYLAQAAVFPKVSDLADGELYTEVTFHEYASGSSAASVSLWARAPLAWTAANNNISTYPHQGIALTWVEPRNSASSRMLQLKNAHTAGAVAPTLATFNGQNGGLPLPAVGSTWAMRFRFQGRRLQGRVWDTAGAEPTTWMLDVTVPDATAMVTSAGRTALVGDLAAAVTLRYQRFDLDDLTAAPGQAAPTTKLKLWHNNAWRTAKLPKGDGTYVDRGVLRNGDGTLYTG